MADNKSKEPQQPYIAVRPAQYTVLEGFILRMLQEQGASPDADIAAALCLQEKDIQTIISDDGLEGVVEGDASYRAIKADGTGKQFICASGKKGEPNEDNFRPCSPEQLKYFSTLEQVYGSAIPDALKALKAEKYYKAPADWEDKIREE